MKLFTKLAVITGGLALVLASVTPAYADGPPPPDPKPAVKKVQKPKKKPTVRHEYSVPPASAPVYNPAPTPILQRVEPEAKSPIDLWAYGLIETKHAFNRQAFIDHDDCAYGGGLRLNYDGFFLGAEGLTECSDGVDTVKTKKKKKWGYGYYYKYTEVDNEFDRVALYGGWHGYVHDQFVLDVNARHEFASNDRDVTRATALIGYDFKIGQKSMITPYTGVEMLLADRDEVCIEDTTWTLPVGVRTKMALGENFALFGDGSVNFSDDDRQVAVVEAGAEFDFDIAGMPMVLVPSGAWVNRFDGGDEDTKKYGGYGYYGYGRNCHGSDCQQDDQYWVAKLELRAKISDLVN